MLGEGTYIYRHLVLSSCLCWARVLEEAGQVCIITPGAIPAAIRSERSGIGLRLWGTGVGMVLERRWTRLAVGQSSPSFVVAE